MCSAFHRYPVFWTVPADFQWNISSDGLRLLQPHHPRSWPLVLWEIFMWTVWLTFWCVRNIRHLFYTLFDFSACCFIALLKQNTIDRFSYIERKWMMKINGKRHTETHTHLKFPHRKLLDNTKFNSVKSKFFFWGWNKTGFRFGCVFNVLLQVFRLDCDFIDFRRLQQRTKKIRYSQCKFISAKISAFFF